MLQNGQFKLSKENQILVQNVEPAIAMHLFLISVIAVIVFMLIIIITFMYLYKIM